MTKIRFSRQVQKDLECLHPGEDGEKLCRDFYAAKYKKTLLIAVAGIALALLTGVRAAAERRISPGNVIARQDFAGDVQELSLEAAIGKEKEQFLVRVWPRQLGEQEAEELYGTFRSSLPELIVGDNASLAEVRQDLLLAEQFEGYPFAVDWRSSAADVIASSGAVTAGEEEREIVLTAEITYGDMAWLEQLSATVPAKELTPQQKQRGELERLLAEGEQSSRGGEQWILPEQWLGSPITWSRKTDDHSLALGAGALAAAAAVYFMADRDLHEEVEKRKKKMKLKYPDVVHKLVLYLGAGMTLRGAFQKIASEYEQMRGGRGGGEPVYEEILYTCRELQTGISEGEAYERFGKRTGLLEYIRLTTLLTQNLKKGSSSLLQRLREEADRACAERIQNGRRLGEEASTKLLVPMVMMLAAIMVMVMLPAMTSMGM